METLAGQVKAGMRTLGETAAETTHTGELQGTGMQDTGTRSQPGVFVIPRLISTTTRIPAGV